MHLCTTRTLQKPPQFETQRSRHLLRQEKQAPRLEPEQMQPAGPFGRKKKEENNTVSKLKATTEAKDP